MKKRLLKDPASLGAIAVNIFMLAIVGWFGINFVAGYFNFQHVLIDTSDPNRYVAYLVADLSTID